MHIQNPTNCAVAHTYTYTPPNTNIDRNRKGLVPTVTEKNLFQEGSKEEEFIHRL